MKKISSHITIAVLIIIILLGTFYFYNKDTQTVEVIGNARMSVMPDEALVYLQIETKDKSAEEAKNKNALITANVISSLTNIGIAQENIQTENYNIYPEYDYEKGREITGYIASNYIKVITKDFNSVGKIIDSSVNSGALINYINFELSTEKSNEYKKLVLAEASKDSKEKAQAIAEGLDKKLGSLISISSSDYNYMPYPLYREGTAQDAKAVATNIQPKNLEVSASIKAIYKIR